jgi:hypothetical protein
MELGNQFLFTIGVSIVLGMRAVMPQISNVVTLPAEFHLVRSGNSIRRKRHESVMSSVMERGLKRRPGEEQERRQARTTTEEQMDSITHVLLGTAHLLERYAS